MSQYHSSTQRFVLLSMLTAFGLVLFVFEAFLPILPWFRPGFGNVATILALMLFGFGDAVKVTLLRVVLGALILGRLFTPLFMFALAGGVASVCVMAFLFVYMKHIFGPVGISVLGAVVHNMVQLALAYFLFVKRTELGIFIPIFLLVGVVTGIITGLTAAFIGELSEKRLSLQVLRYTR